jgi:hypothetical protein
VVAGSGGLGTPPPMGITKEKERRDDRTEEEQSGSTGR